LKDLILIFAVILVGEDEMALGPLSLNREPCANGIVFPVRGRRFFRHDQFKLFTVFPKCPLEKEGESRHFLNVFFDSVITFFVLYSVTCLFKFSPFLPEDEGSSILDF
jgi:hypothetical protein